MIASSLSKMNQFWIPTWWIGKFSWKRTLLLWANPKVELETIFHFLKYLITNQVTKWVSLRGQFWIDISQIKSMTSRAQHIVLRSVLLSRQCNSKILPSSKENKNLPQNLPQIQFTILTSRNKKLRNQKGPPMKSKWPNGSKRKFHSVHPWLVLHQNPPEQKAKKSRSKLTKKRRNKDHLIQSL